MINWRPRARVAVAAATCLAAVCGGIAAASPRIYTVAGTGKAGASGGGRPATDATFQGPRAVAVAADGSVVVADTGNDQIRRISRAGVVTVVAGTGGTGESGDGGPARAARLSDPAGVAVLPDGSVLIADTGGHRIRRVDAQGTITTVAGTGVSGFSGDDGGASVATLNLPAGVLDLPGGGFLIVDTGNNRVRRVDAGGTITTVAGTGEAGFSGDDGPAVQARLNGPTAVALAPDGAVLIADTMNLRVRRVAPDGTIATLAGGGDAGDGGPATRARLAPPTGVAVRADATVLIAGGDRVRRVTPDGLIRTLAGGRRSVLGDGHDPRRAGFLDLSGIAVTPDGGYLVSDARAHKVRLVIDGSGRTLRRLAASFVSEGFGARPGEEVRIRVASTRGARALLMVARREDYRRTLREGVVAFTIRAPRRPGRYELRLAATGGDQTVSDYALLRVR